MSWHATTFEVEGDLRFPLVMLRHELCSPASDRDAVAIERTFDAPIRVTVRLVRLHKDAWAPDAERWAAYGWRLVDGGVTVPA